MSQNIHVFDAYGTLFDVHSAVARLKREIGPSAERLSEIWRAKTLEYTWIRALAGKPASFRKCLKDGLDFAASATGDLSGDTRIKLLEAYDSLSSFPEVKDALLALKKKRARLAVLSNGDPDMIDRAVRAAGLEDLFDHLLSVSEVGIFKPSSRVYRLAMTKFGAAREDVTFISSNRWDVAGASAFGFKTVWVNRSRAPDEYADMPAAAVVQDLRGLPLLQAAR
jgi:2-haloacid dehalogenase